MDLPTHVRGRTRSFPHFPCIAWTSPSASDNPLDCRAMIYSSPYGRLPIPEGETIWMALERQAATNGTKPAFVCGLTGRKITFREAHTQARQVCAGLVAYGIKSGDVGQCVSLCAWLSVGV